MKPSCGFVLLLSLCIFFQQHIHAETAEEDDDVDNDDDGVVEVEPDKPPVVEVKKKYEKPNLLRKPHLAETFDSKEAFARTWTQSEAKKEGTDESIAKYDGQWSVEVPKDSSLLEDLALVLKSKAKHHAIARKLSRPFEFSDKPLMVSYEVKFQNGIDCGGAYIKLLSRSDNLDLKSFHDKTPYTVMFGPDKCGLDHKLHFIFRHKNPKTGEIEEKHAKKPEGSLDKYFTDKKTHLYTLIVRPDNSYEVLVDNKVINSGDLLKDFNPPVIPPKEIDDPNDQKPESWDEREKIPDPLATKPEDWDEDQPLEVPDEEAKKPEGWLDDEEALVKDPEASKPADWDDEMDGEWEAPLIDNPKCKDAPGCGQWTRPSIPNPLYKGKWKAPMIDNPNYQGEWKPKKIQNPSWFEDKTPYRMTPINALGLELWSMTDDIVFDNFIVTDDKDIHESWVLQTWERKNTAESSSGDGQGIWSTLMSSAEERPWLYAVYVTVFLIPIVLLAICLCPRSGPIKQETLDAARKKTDESSPDDKPADGAGAIKKSSEAAIGPAGDNSPRKSKKSKAALEKEEEGSEEEEDNKEEEDSKEEEDNKEEEDSKEEDNKDEEDLNASEEAKKEDVGKDSLRKSPKRRKPRKD